MQPVVPVYDVARQLRRRARRRRPRQQQQPAQGRLRGAQQRQQEQPRLRQRVRRLRAHAGAARCAARSASTVNAGRVQRLQPDHARELRADVHQLDQREPEPVHRLDVEQHGAVQPDARRSTRSTCCSGRKPTQARNRVHLRRRSATCSTRTSNSRYIQDALGDATTKNVSSTGGQSALLSFFGKADYNFADKYVASFTVRRDGSSRLGPDHRWGTFPAFGLGWRITKEPFLEDNHILSDVMLRFGWGVTGNQHIPSGRIVSQFGGDRGDTFYDITGSTTARRRRLPADVARQPGPEVGGEPLARTSAPTSRCSTARSTSSSTSTSARRTTCSSTRRCRRRPASPTPPIVNIGKMQNTGFDFSRRPPGRRVERHVQRQPLQEQDRLDRRRCRTSSTARSRLRFGNQVINQVGSADRRVLRLHGGRLLPATRPTSRRHATQDGAAPGRIKFRDVNGDGKIT